MVELALLPGIPPPVVIDIDMTEGNGDAVVELAKLWFPPFPLKIICGRIVTTVKATRSPDFRISVTTVS